MKRLLFVVSALVFGAGAAAAQNVPRPDCIIDVSLIAAGQSAGGTGTCGTNINGVFEWRLSYKSVGFTALSLIVQSAPVDASGTCTAAVWVPFAGTVSGGVNPNTATTQATTNFTGFYPCVRVFLTSVMGSGTIIGQLYGCREPGCSIAGVAISAVIPTPVPVDGPTAAGSPPTTPPVLVAGQDGAPGNIRTLQTDTAGELIPANASSADADGVSNTESTPTGAGGGILYPRVFNRVFDGTTWARMRGNTFGTFSQGPVASGIALAGNPVRIGASDGTNTRDVSSDAAGELIPANAAVVGADGISNTQQSPVGAGAAPLYLRVLPDVFNGATNDRQFSCMFQAVQILAPGTTGRLVLGVMGKTTKICHYHLSDDTAANVTITSGTGTNCGSGTANIDAYTKITQFAMDFSPLSPLKANAPGDDICYTFSVSVANASFTVIYAQF